MEDWPPVAPRAIYGTILVTALIAGLSEDPSYGNTDILISVVTTVLVFWVAHVYAEVLSSQARRDDPWGFRIVRDAMVGERPLLQAATLPCAILLLGAMNVYPRDTSVGVAIGFGVASLFVFGFAFARRLRHSFWGGVLAGAFNGGVGVVIVVLKLLLH
jgi:hypothetical protein